MRGEFVGNVVANVVNKILQLMVEQVTYHRHPALHPLATATKLGMIKLSHRPISVVDGYQHVRRRIRGDAIALRLWKRLNK